MGVENKNNLKDRMIEEKKLAENYQKLAAVIQTVKKQIEKIKKKWISDESRAKATELDKEEGQLMEKFISMKAIEIKTMKINDENFEENWIKYFKFWVEAMDKKFEFKSKCVKINLVVSYTSNLSKNNINQ